MKLQELSRYLKNINPDDIEIDFSEAIVHDEFNKQVKRYDQKFDKGYRERAIERLIESNLEWHSHSNIEIEVMQLFLKVKCPYCGENMNFLGHSGKMYKCECGAIANISNPEISFVPNQESK